VYMLRRVNQIARDISLREWIFIRSKKGYQFLLSDNPVFSYDSIKDKITIEPSVNSNIYFPITKDIGLIIKPNLSLNCHYMNTEKEYIKVLNLGTVQFSFNQIISHSKELISYYIEKHKQIVKNN
ncbi:DUF4238 domain-containing protein, partial [Aneurinibacillus migulanus]|uniref:DUF4238 domain-containing protein n=1 Tax=Aneurinibacillus migulanus TaxID=47500 RepID=UPI00209CFBF7